MKNQEEKINILTSIFSIFQKSVEWSKKYSFIDMAKGLFALIVSVAILFAFLNPSYIFEKYNKWAAKQHTAQLNARMTNNIKINAILEKTLYRLNADRILLLECHNNLVGSGGFPFARCTATFEADKEGIIPISNQYQDINLSLLKFSSYLFKNNFFCGDIDDIREIDNMLYFKMGANSTKHFAACVINGVETPLAFLFISYTTNEHDCYATRKVMESVSKELALLLELNKIGS